MRAIILAVLVAAGIGLAATPTVYAAPANGVAIGEDANVSNSIVQVQWRRRHWRWGSRGSWRRCHAPFDSRYYRC